MPELPEVEVLVRHLRPLVTGRKIRRVEVRRAKVLGRTPESKLKRVLRGATIKGLTRRGKYLLFELRRKSDAGTVILVGHLGMTGRMYLSSDKVALPKHAAVTLEFGDRRMIYEDTRYFGRLTLEQTGLVTLGPEPLGDEFTEAYLAAALKRSAQAIKVRLLDQKLVAGVGNIYASEALFRARISPRLASNRLSATQTAELHKAIREVLAEAIKYGSTVPLEFTGRGERDGLFYYGGIEGSPDSYEERLLVYDRRGEKCVHCRTPIRRLVQAARSTYYCPCCQRA
jgi:formamidopyrimidine-DNA glycosylase